MVHGMRTVRNINTKFWLEILKRNNFFWKVRAQILDNINTDLKCVTCQQLDGNLD